MPRLAVIADDLTGANDTGVQLRKFGFRTIVSFGSLSQNSLPHDVDIVVVDTDSRAMPSAVAGEKVRQSCRMLRRLGVDNLYKKIDSTLRGNIGAEISAACEEFQPAVTVIAPAYPKAARVTVGGYQLLAGMPISLTEMARDPKTPVSEAWIPNLPDMEDRCKVGAIPLQTVMNGTQAIYEEIGRCLSAGTDRIVFDAVCEENLCHIAQAAMPFERVLWVGSAGLAEQLPVALNWTKKGKSEVLTQPCDSVLVVAGSVSGVTQKQLRTYVEKVGAANIVVDSVAAIATPSNEVARIVSEAATLPAGKDIVVSCSGEKQAVDKAMLAGKSIGIAAGQVGARIAMVLGLVAAELVGRQGRGLFLTGGETAVRSCQALGASAIEIVKEVLPGIPLGQLCDGPFKGLPVITKAGAFGDTHAIVKAVNSLKGHET